MGQIIRKDVGAGDIYADVRSTYINAQSQGGPFKEIAATRFAGVVTLVETIEEARTQTTKAAQQAAALVAAADAKADALIGQVHDTIWNAIGRPGSDPALDVLFPGGIAFYCEGDDGEEPVRMRLLERLLRSGIHPRLDKQLASSLADRIHTEAEAYAKVFDEARTPLAEARLAQRAWTVMARSAQIELAALKRAYKSAGLTEAKIHEVIPDRPRKAGTPSTASGVPVQDAAAPGQ